MTASTTTTIEGVSIFSRQHNRKADVFDIALSPEGISVRRPGRSEQHLAWERVTQWEIEERPGCVVLTLRGGGSATPLMVKGWTLEDLETVMRDVTEGTPAPPVEPAAPAPLPPVSVPPAPLPPVSVPPAPLPPVSVPPAPVPPVSVPPVSVPPVSVPPISVPPAPVPPVTPPVQPRAVRRRAARPPRRRVWKPLVTIVLLGVLAAAVTLVLLQSAGVISWSFLGPVA